MRAIAFTAYQYADRELSYQRRAFEMVAYERRKMVDPDFEAMVENQRRKNMWGP